VAVKWTDVLIATSKKYKKNREDKGHCWEILP